MALVNKILRVTTGIMPFALRDNIAVQFVPDKLVAQDDSIVRRLHKEHCRQD